MVKALWASVRQRVILPEHKRRAHRWISALAFLKPGSTDVAHILLQRLRPLSLRYPFILLVAYGTQRLVS